MKFASSSDELLSGATTRERVGRLLLQHGPSTAGVLADRLGLTPAAVRRHLDALVEAELVSASERAPYGPVGRRGRGRPAKVFALTDEGRAQFPQAYDTLAADALRYLQATGGTAAVQDFARTRMANVLEPVRAAVLAAAPRDRTERLAEGLTDVGFAASVEPAPSGAGHQLCQHHCPVAHVAAEFPALCEAETEAFADLLGTHVQRLATIGHGDQICTTFVPHPTEGTRA